MTGYVEAGYAVILVTLAGYSTLVVRRHRSLRRSARRLGEVREAEQAPAAEGTPWR